MLRIAEHSAVTDRGRQRRSNEDAVLSDAPLFAVADGMGGARAGEVASELTVEALASLPGEGSAEQRLAAVAHDANRRIHELAATDTERAGMGSTLIAAYLDEQGVAIAHVGDSRAYRLSDGKLERLTRDHSLVGMWVQRGDLTEAEAEAHPQRSVITRALGPEPEVEVDTQTAPARPGDVFLLCSDGLTSMVPDAAIAELMTQAGPLPELADRLVATANDRGGRDNVSVVLFRVEDAEISGGTGAAATAELDATRVGDDAPSVAEVRAAVAARERDQGASGTGAPPGAAPVRRRDPRPPRPAPATGRPRRRRRFGFAIFLAFVLAAVLIGGWIATRGVYFVSTTAEGFVSVDRGLPYDGPFGIRLYETVFRSGVTAAQLPAARRATLLDHRLRSQSDAFGLVRQADAGKLGQ